MIMTFFSALTDWLGEVINVYRNIDIGGVTGWAFLVGVVAFAIIISVFWRGAKG